MQMPKDRIVEMIRRRLGGEEAGQADQELPETVDSERDHDLLAKYGIDPQELHGRSDGEPPGA